MQSANIFGGGLFRAIAKRHPIGLAVLIKFCFDEWLTWSVIASCFWCRHPRRKMTRLTFRPTIGSRKPGKPFSREIDSRGTNYWRQETVITHPSAERPHNLRSKNILKRQRFSLQSYLFFELYRIDSLKFLAFPWVCVRGNQVVCRDVLVLMCSMRYILYRPAQ